jgi:hypothetical protein
MKPPDGTCTEQRRKADDGDDRGDSGEQPSAETIAEPLAYLSRPRELLWAAGRRRPPQLKPTLCPLLGDRSS